MANYRFIVIGGDLRQVYLANFLCMKGHSVITYGINHPQLSKNCIPASTFAQLIAPHTQIVLPLPVTKDGSHLFITDTESPISLEDVKEYVTPENTVFGGVMPKGLAADFKYRGIPFYDLMADSAVAIRNGIATAEGAIAHAVLDSCITLHHAPALVLGYGRCGKILADKLKGMSAAVSICARNPTDLALGESLGYGIVPFSKLKRHLKKYKFIFNTIPAPVLTSSCLDKIGPDTVIIDIASVPGGTDFNYAKKKGINAKLYLGIPGKTAARSSGEILAEAILEYLL